MWVLDGISKIERQPYVDNRFVFQTESRTEFILSQGLNRQPVVQISLANYWYRLSDCGPIREDKFDKDRDSYHSIVSMAMQQNHLLPHLYSPSAPTGACPSTFERISLKKIKKMVGQCEGGLSGYVLQRPEAVKF